MSDLEQILRDLNESEISALMSRLWDGGIDVRLGDELIAHDAEARVSTSLRLRPG
jgi:hypothetical protein